MGCVLVMLKTKTQSDEKGIELLHACQLYTGENVAAGPGESVSLLINRVVEDQVTYGGYTKIS